MDRIETPDYLIKLLDHNDPDELREVQRLRYDFLLKVFDENKTDAAGLDDDGFDAFSDSILAIDKKTGRIVGTYRVATEKTLQGRPFKSEEEFDISALQAEPEGIIETGRAVVHGGYRSGVVIGLLWKALISYARDEGLRYIFGTCSLRGTDPGEYVNCTSFLNQYYVSDRYDIRAARNAFEYGTKKDLSIAEARIPSLLKAYLKIGARVSRNGFIDYEFNCCDVMIVMDRLGLHERYVKRFFGA
nr:GNAT family N-acetyltransferase [Lachnospiraceae bacterium]